MANRKARCRRSRNLEVTNETKVQSSNTHYSAQKKRSPRRVIACYKYFCAGVGSAEGASLYFKLCLDSGEQWPRMLLNTRKMLEFS